MFQYTQAGINLIIRDLKRTINVIKYIFLVFSLGYYVFALISNIGIFYVNIALLSLMSVYTIFELCTLKMKSKKPKVVVKRIYSWLKIAVKAFALGSSIYGIYIAVVSTSPLSIIITTLMIILWVLETIFEIVTEIVESKTEILIAGWKKDIEPLVKVDNMRKKIFGGEIKEHKIDESKIHILDAIIEKRKNKKKNV